jgi:hypothetical protein
LQSGAKKILQSIKQTWIQFIFVFIPTILIIIFVNLTSNSNFINIAIKEFITEYSLIIYILFNC